MQNALHEIYAKTLQEMAEGCLTELTLTLEKSYDYQSIIDIIVQETSTLIKNSLLLGFMTNFPQEHDAVQIVENIGNKVGFLFQTMNDLEPFCAQNSLTLHKGGLNLDFNRARKNIVLPYIYGSCSVHEKKQLLADENTDIDKLFTLYNKYKVESIIRNDLLITEKQIEVHFEELAKKDINLLGLADFKNFYRNIIDIAKNRLENILQEPID